MKWTQEQYQNYLDKKVTTKKVSKYKNEPSIVDGIIFDSKMEANFYCYLKLKFKEIILQPKFILQPTFHDSDGNTVRAINYIADFRVGDIVIDCKGFPTKDFKIKEKLFRYKYPQYRLLVGTDKELKRLI